MDAVHTSEASLNIPQAQLDVKAFSPFFQGCAKVAHFPHPRDERMKKLKGLINNSSS
jgi:hypothetical protein